MGRILGVEFIKVGDEKNVHPFKKKHSHCMVPVKGMVSSPIFYHGFWGLFQQG
jgi:hypothetical protein